jgi:hypothetical protein
MLRSPFETLFPMTFLHGHGSAPVAPEGGKWDTGVGYPMRSAYAVKNGREPNFTNFAQIKVGRCRLIPA